MMQVEFATHPLLLSSKAAIGFDEFTIIKFQLVFGRNKNFVAERFSLTTTNFAFKLLACITYFFFCKLTASVTNFE